MAHKYRVKTSRVAGHKPGDTFAPPEGVNVKALVRAGHVEPIKQKKKPAKSKGGE